MFDRLKFPEMIYFFGNPEQIPPNAKTSPTSSFLFPGNKVVYNGPTWRTQPTKSLPKKLF